MTKAQAKDKLARIAKEKNGTLTQSGIFVDLPHNPNVVGYGAVPARDGKSWQIVSVPR